MTSELNAFDADIAAALTGGSDPLAISDEEGQFADHGSVVNALKHLLAHKYQLMLSYVNYGDTLRHLARDGLYAHFQEHAAEERGHAYELAKRLTALGETADVSLGVLAPVATVEEALLALLRLEQQAQQMWRTLRSYAGENLSLDSFCQDSAWRDGQHADDLRRYLRSPK